jgi:hypothetical protein
MQNNKIENTIQIKYLNGLHSLYFLYLVLFCYWKLCILLFLLFEKFRKNDLQGSRALSSVHKSIS